MKGTDPNPSVHQGFGTQAAVVDVESIIRGLPKDAQKIRVNPSIGSSCYFPLIPGERWLIFGRISAEDSSLILSGSCYGSQRISGGGDDIKRKIASFQGGPSLFLGDVTYLNSAVKDAEVSLTGGARPWSVKTGESGHFEVENMPPGTYDLNVSKPGLDIMWIAIGAHLQKTSPIKVDIPAQGCVEATAILQPGKVP